MPAAVTRGGLQSIVVSGLGDLLRAVEATSKSRLLVGAERKFGTGIGALLATMTP